MTPRTLVGLARDGSKGRNCVEEDAAVGHGLFQHGMEDDSVEFDDVFCGSGRSGFLPETVTADGGVEAVFRIGVVGVESEADLAGWWTGTGLVDIGHVHEVVLKGGVVVVADATWGGVVYGDGDMGYGEAAVVVAQSTAYSGWFAEYARGGHGGRRRECWPTLYTKKVSSTGLTGSGSALDPTVVVFFLRDNLHFAPPFSLFCFMALTATAQSALPAWDETIVPALRKST